MATDYNRRRIGRTHQCAGSGWDERVRNYARVMTDMVEDGFPNAFMAQRLPEGELKDFFTVSVGIQAQDDSCRPLSARA